MRILIVWRALYVCSIAYALHGQSVTLVRVISADVRLNSFTSVPYKTCRALNELVLEVYVLNVPCSFSRHKHSLYFL